MNVNVMWITPSVECKIMLEAGSYSSVHAVRVFINTITVYGRQCESTYRLVNMPQRFSCKELI